MSTRIRQIGLRFVQLLVVVCAIGSWTAAGLASELSSQPSDEMSQQGIKRIAPIENNKPAMLRSADPDDQVDSIHRRVDRYPLRLAQNSVDASTEPALPKLDIRPMQEIDLLVTPTDEVVPPDIARQWMEQQGEVTHVVGTSRHWAMVDYRWAASAVAYHPLYFENANLERYGYTYGYLQPAASYAHFFGNVLLLPYHAVASPYCECVYSLGYGRPGSCGPHRHPRAFPPDGIASAAEAAAIAGAILLVP